MSAVNVKQILFLSPISRNDINDFSESCSISFEESPKRKTIKDSRVLKEMGFNIGVDNSPLIIGNRNNKISRRSSIGVSDFWSICEKEKFLKEKGYWDAYKNLQIKEAQQKLKTIKSIRCPSLPHIMDLNTIRRIKLDEVKSVKKATHGHGQISTKRFATEESPKKIDIKYKQYSKPRIQSKKTSQLKTIDFLLDKCNNLASDAIRLKNSTEKFKKSFSRQCVETISNEQCKKLTTRELKKIKSDLKKISKNVHN
ncbi:hypothetical protein SteCoe_20706 [Stentor coeruleus]|uniref:Uncharacterized protein n=1 Tax=Stentor coeruleus TaxID=5963 RepID=A0A1R2BRT0_9CILI|nr:hypothetical protein SteCoe_20706 [Stentor coeruleus]